jgi:hypothetical protein
VEYTWLTFYSSLAQRYVSGLIQTFLELKFTFKYDPELDFLKQKWVMSAECSRIDSLRPFILCTYICVRGNTDISGINSYGYLWSETWLSQTEECYVCRVEYTWLTSSLPLLHRHICPG